MQAAFYESYGGVEVVKVGALPKAELGKSDEVLVKIQAAALNPIDFIVRNGWIPQPNRALPAVVGYDLAGVVERVGEGVTKFKVGDEVYGNMQEFGTSPGQYGSLAEYAAVPERLLASKPSNLTAQQAAAFPVAALTSYVGLSLALGEQSQGKKVLITGGAGGVGTFAVQIAKHYFNAFVATTASGAKVSVVKDLGADLVIDYREKKFEEELSEYDAVFDTTGEAEKALKILKEGVTAITVKSPVANPRVKFFALQSKGEDLEKLRPLIESGKIRPVVDRVYKLAEARDAFTYLESGRALGKVVVSIP